MMGLPTDTAAVVAAAWWTRLATAWLSLGSEAELALAPQHPTTTSVVVIKTILTTEYLLREDRAGTLTNTNTMPDTMMTLHVVEE